MKFYKICLDLTLEFPIGNDKIVHCVYLSISYSCRGRRNNFLRTCRTFATTLRPRFGKLISLVELVKE